MRSIVSGERSPFDQQCTSEIARRIQQCKAVAACWEWSEIYFSRIALDHVGIHQLPEAVPELNAAECVLAPLPIHPHDVGSRIGKNLNLSLDWIGDADSTIDLDAERRGRKVEVGEDARWIWCCGRYDHWELIGHVGQHSDARVGEGIAACVHL